MKDIIHIAHANGFPGGTYKVIAEQLRHHYDVRWTDVFAHNSDYPVSDNWPHLGAELIHYYEKSYSQPVIAIGHSLGGILSLMVAMHRPDLIKAIIMLDSPLLTPIQASGLKWAKRLKLTDTFMPTKRTEVRRTTWSSKEEAIKYFADKKLMRNFDPRCLEAYVDAGTMAIDGELHLRFNPKTEAKIWRTIPHNINPTEKLKIPGAVIAGKSSNVFARINGAHMKGRLGMKVKWLPGSHMFPFEYPEETATAIAHLLNEMLPRR